MKTKYFFWKYIFLIISTSSIAQIKIGDNPGIINPNSLLELESNVKGILAPRMALNDANLPAPLSPPVPAGMLVYSVGGTLTDGFYNWNGVKWVKLYNSNDLANIVTKTANSTLFKN